MILRRAAAVLALVAAACSDGVGRGGPSPSPTSTRTPSATPAPVPVDAVGALAFTDGRTVRVRTADGAVRTVARPREEVTDLAWSADGRHLAWLGGFPLTVGLLATGSGESAEWTAAENVVAYGLGASPRGFVFVTDGGQLGRVDPAAFLAGGAPSIDPLDVAQPVLLTTGAGRVLAGSLEGTSNHGGPMTVYDVRDDGSAARLFTDGDGLPEGEVRNVAIGEAALTADGNRLVYSTGATAGGCDLAPTVVVRDLAADRERALPGLTLRSDGLEVAASITTGPDGRTVVALSTQVGECASRPAAAAFVLAGTRWRLVARGAEWASYSAAGALATIGLDEVLRTGGQRVASRVTAAAWSPS